MEAIDGAAIARIVLRVAHAIAGAIWLGSGAFLVVALTPLRRLGGDARQLVELAQQYFRRWWIGSSAILLGSGVALMFDRLADGRGTLGYVLVLAVKVLAGLVALAATGGILPQRPHPSMASRPPMALRFSGRTVLALGALAYLLGVLLSLMYPPDPTRGWR